jgi:hypothetical protein
MALVERLMHLDPVKERNMAVHTFFAAIFERLYGQLTTAQIQTYYAMTTEDLVDWNKLVLQFPSTNANKSYWIEHIHSVFLLAEQKAPLYGTPTEVRARLGIT